MLLLQALVSLGCALAGASPGTYPHYPTRSVTRLDGSLPFVFLPDLEVADPSDLDPTTIAFNDWMVVPGAFDSLPRYPMHRGTGVYKIAVDTIPNAVQRLKIEACSLWCQVWVDGAKAGSPHSNGYTAFWVDLPPSPASSRTVYVVADNRFDKDRTPLQNRQYDFYQWGGLTRSVYLHQSKARTWVERVQVTTKDHTTGRVALQVFLSGAPLAGAARFHVSFDGGRAVPVEAERGAGGGYALEPSFLVPDFKLWEPGSPGLHTVTVALGGAGGDAATARFGIRTVVADGPHITINGRRVKLLGYCYHDMAPGYGAAVPAARRRGRSPLDRGRSL
mmetsp:Transcript_54740/g.173840  ORF Transcript_54740/g.173840 Transcript_54740/m.173840 type:complete len:334 (-) Transcript_54740:230-1231(-)